LDREEKEAYNLLKTKSKKLKYWLITLVCCMVVLPVAAILIIRLEGEKPSITLKLPSRAIGVSQTATISISDKRSGVRRVWVGLLQDGKEVDLLNKSFPGAGFIKGGKVHEEPSLTIEIEPKKKDFSDGKAILRMVVWDYSWRGWWRGNKTYAEKEVWIDTKPPEVEVLSKFHNVNQGGAGLVIYRLSEPCPASGAYVGEAFFPGYSGYFSDANVLMAFFSLNYKQGPGTEILVKAVDQAGNSARSGLNFHIRKKVFKKDVIRISDKFLSRKMPEFDGDIPQEAKSTAVDKYLYVNRKLRNASYKRIIEVTAKTDAVVYWDGPFLRLPRSKRSAGFADDREYKHQGRTIDKQVHLGVDLASVLHSPVPASNRGKVAFAGYIGIYGKTVIIDHGFGLFSMYSHLSGIDVKKGHIAEKGEIIGRTGSTGLAGGDHLHFSMAVHHSPVNPIEWWDAGWIKNNITTKMDTIKSGLNDRGTGRDKG